MAQANWDGFSVTADDLTLAGDELWDASAEGFSAPVGVKITNAGGDLLYVHIVGIHIHDSDSNQTNWTFTLIPVGESMEFISRHPSKPVGTMLKAWAWVSTAGTGTITWTPTVFLNGMD